MTWKKALLYPVLLLSAVNLYSQEFFWQNNHPLPIMKNELPASILLNQLRSNYNWQDKTIEPDLPDDIPGIMRSIPADIDASFLPEEGVELIGGAEFNSDKDLDAQPVSVITLPGDNISEFVVALGVIPASRIDSEEAEESGISAFMRWTMGDRSAPPPRKKSWEDEILRIVQDIHQDDYIDNDLSEEHNRELLKPDTSIIYTGEAGQWIIICNGGGKEDGSDGGDGENEEAGRGEKEENEGGESQSSATEAGGRLSPGVTKKAATNTLVCQSQPITHDGSGSQPSAALVQCADCGAEEIDPNNVAEHLLTCDKVSDQTKKVLEQLLAKIQAKPEVKTAKEPAHDAGEPTTITRRLQGQIDSIHRSLDVLSNGHKEIKKVCEGRLSLLETVVSDCLDNKIKRLLASEESSRMMLNQLGVDLKWAKQQFEIRSTNGMLFYALREFSKFREEEAPVVYTYIVKTSEQGYRNKFQIMRQGGALVVRHLLMSDENDGFQEWPFRAKITITLIHSSDPSKNVVISRDVTNQKQQKQGVVADRPRAPVRPIELMALTELHEQGFIQDDDQLLLKFQIEQQPPGQTLRRKPKKTASSLPSKD